MSVIYEHKDKYSPIILQTEHTELKILQINVSKFAVKFS